MADNLSSRRDSDGTLPIVPIRKINSTNEVYNQMSRLILNREWLPGAKLPSENELAEQFGVSRVTVRAAIQKLKALHLLESRVGSGTYISKAQGASTLSGLIPAIYLGGSSMYEIFQYRDIIETGSMPLAIQNQTPEDIQELSDYLEKMQDCADQDNVKEFAESDFRFHMKIGKMTKNSLIMETNQILYHVLRQAMYDVVAKMRYRNGLAYHRRIIDAIRERDVQEAGSLMHEHITGNYSYFDDRKEDGETS